MRQWTRAIVWTAAITVMAAGETFDRAAITVRVGEPMVLSGDRFPAFGGIAVDRIVLYQRTSAGTWIEIPTQVDERIVDNLKDNLPSGCQYTWDPCELTYLLSGTETGAGAGLDSDDEVAFMPRDSGVQAATNQWVGVPNQDTLSTRYSIVVQDTNNSEVGWVYAYAWLRTPDHPPAYPPGQLQVDDYVSWTGPGTIPCRPSGDPACGWMKSTDQGSAAGLARMNMFFAGNWTASALCIRTGTDDGTCSPTNSSKNLLDETKWRTDGPNENEGGWDQGCRAFLGVKDGPVRIIRRTQGAMSGRYTTKVELGYGTWYEQIVNLRVHPIDAIHVWIDNRVPNVSSPPGESPSLIFAQQHSESNNNLSADTIDGSFDGTFDSVAGDWTQIDSARGTFVHYLDTKRGFRDVIRRKEYQDDRFSGDQQEFQPGFFGQYGDKFSQSPQLPSFEDLVCNATDPEDPSLNFGRIQRTLIPLPADSQTGSPPAYRSEEGAAAQANRVSPLFASVSPEVYVVPLPPPVPPCKPGLTGQSSSGAFSTHLSLSMSGCDSETIGSSLFRGTAPGVYAFLADLGPRVSFEDLTARNATTYRYIARAYDRSGNYGPASDELVITVNDTVAPPVPIGVVAVPGSQKVTISWDQLGGLDYRGMYVEKATSPNGPFVRLNASSPAPPDSVSFTAISLTPGVTYYFKLKSTDFVGNESTYSIAVSATPSP